MRPAVGRVEHSYCAEKISKKYAPSCSTSYIQGGIGPKLDEQIRYQSGLAMEFAMGPEMLPKPIIVSR